MYTHTFMHHSTQLHPGSFSGYITYILYTQVCGHPPSPVAVSMYLCFLSALPLASLSVVQTSSPPSISPPLSHRPSSVLAPVVFHRRRTEHLSAPLLITLKRPGVIVVCVGKHACECVCVHCSFIAFQAYLLGIAVHSQPTYAL